MLTFSFQILEIAHLQNVIPFAEIQGSPYIVLATTGGGHVGWFEGGNKRWYVEPVREFLGAFLEASVFLPGWKFFRNSFS
ncbi:MAG TPA: hypothetical protein VGO47_13265 [Chlamydiales bacterium]|nr:hypothetical protein [Chlamydiales bacterium]